MTYLHWEIFQKIPVFVYNFVPTQALIHLQQHLNTQNQCMQVISATISDDSWKKEREHVCVYMWLFMHNCWETLALSSTET